MKHKHFKQNDYLLIPVKIPDTKKLTQNFKQEDFYDINKKLDACRNNKTCGLSHFPYKPGIIGNYLCAGTLQYG